MLNRGDDKNEEKKLILFCVAAASTVLLLFLVVLYFAESKKTVKRAAAPKEQADTTAEQVDVNRSDFVSKDLDFWEMFDDTEDIEADEEDDEYNRISLREKAKRDREKAEAEAEDSETDSEEESKDEADDGRHIKVVGKDGKEAVYEINNDIEKNSYSFEDYLSNDNGVLKYNGSNNKSITGLDLSNANGTVDFAKLKEAGVDYVILRVGSRGYDSGAVAIDDKFIEYAMGAAAAGLQIGTYFTTNAITELEALEEANYTVAAGMNYNTKYPVAIDITTLSSAARTDRLTVKERTAIVKKFCDTVKSYGKIPAICATRDCLIAGIDLTELSAYEIWLKDDAVTESSADKDYIGTDYPYQFSMWRYTTNGSMVGMSGPVNLNMSFVNYAER